MGRGLEELQALTAAMRGPERRSRRPSLNTLILLIAFATIAAASWSAWVAVNGTNQNAVKDRLDSDTAETAALYQRLTAAVALAPTAVSGLVTTVGPDSVTRANFNAFSGPLIDEQVLVATRWVPYVPGDQRPAFETKVQETGLLDFSIHDRATDGTLVPAAIRPDYYPILFSEPAAAEGEIVGFDMGSSAVRRNAIEDARDSGNFVVTPALDISAGGRGALLMVPAYLGGATLPTIEERRAAFLGVAVAVFRPQELLMRATSRLAGQDLSFTILDLGPVDEPRLPIDQGAVVASRTSSSAGTSTDSPGALVTLAPVTADVPFGERNQVLEVRAGPRYLQEGITSPLTILLTAFASLAAVALYAVQRRRFEGALAGAAARLRSVLSASPDAFVGLDERGRVVDWSDQATRLFGMPRGVALGRRISSLLEVQGDSRGGESPMNEAIASLPEAGSTIAMELTAVQADGNRVPVDVTMAISPTSARWTVACFIRDATERYRARDELLRARAAETIGELTGRLAHDFNNLLGIIVGTLDLARDDVADRPDTQRLLDMAMAAGVRGADVTKALLAVARRQALAPTDLDLNDTVREVHPLLRQAVGQEITVELDLDIQPVLSHLDPGGLTNAILNLTINAAHAMPDGGTLRVSTRRTSDGCTLSVADTGVGIAPEALAKVFEPFFTTKKGGTGLGLAIVNGFATQSGGSATISSRLGEGTTVTLRLPPSVGDTSTIAPAVPTDTRGTERVLVVDDEAGLREIASRWLRDAGYEVFQAPSGPAGLAMIEEVEPALLVTDVIMPGEYGGLELARRARAARPNLRIILASGYAGVDLEGVIESGLPLLEKPYRRATLLEASRGALDAPTPIGLAAAVG